QASWPAIKAWARANPQRVQEMLHANPRVVFFREEPLADPTVGPVGAQGVPLSPGRSIAVDKESVPYGTPVWIDTT
ncbi:transglycosylase, partial [Vibrio parahaemolyticus]|nr:transglycosylase [Vibrio parahaemolyticus]